MGGGQDQTPRIRTARPTHYTGGGWVASRASLETAPMTPPSTERRPFQAITGHYSDRSIGTLTRKLRTFSVCLNIHFRTFYINVYV